MKTQSISINVGDVAKEEIKTADESSSAIDFFHTVKIKYEEDKKEVLSTKKITNINKFAYTFPEFYKKEMRNAFGTFICWVFIFILTLAGVGLAIWQIVINENIDNWICVLLIIPFVLAFSFFIIYADKFYAFRREAKTISFKESKTVSINIQKLYRRLKTGHININWMCGMVYCISVLVFFFNALIFWFINKGASETSDFLIGDWFLQFKFTQDITYFIISLVSLICFFGAVILHATLLITNYLRISQIDSYYGYEIVATEELTILKKKKNRRDLFIFLTAVVLIGLICWLIYRLIKRRKLQQTVVISK